MTITNRPCKYCGKDLIFDTRIKSRNGFVVPLNLDRRPHGKCWKRIVKQQLGGKTETIKQVVL